MIVDRRGQRILGQRDSGCRSTPRHAGRSKFGLGRISGRCARHALGCGFELPFRQEATVALRHARRGAVRRRRDRRTRGASLGSRSITKVLRAGSGRSSRPACSSAPSSSRTGLLGEVHRPASARRSCAKLRRQPRTSWRGRDSPLLLKRTRFRDEGSLHHAQLSSFGPANAAGLVRAAGSPVSATRRGDRTCESSRPTDGLAGHRKNRSMAITVERFRYAPAVAFENLAYHGNMATQGAELRGAPASRYSASSDREFRERRARFVATSSPNVVATRNWWFPGGLVGTWVRRTVARPRSSPHFTATDVRLARGHADGRGPLVSARDAAGRTRFTAVSRLPRDRGVQDREVASLRSFAGRWPVATDLFFSRGDGAARRRGGLLFVGAPQPKQKGARTGLLDALAEGRRPNASLDVIGDGSPRKSGARRVAATLARPSRDRVRWARFDEAARAGHALSASCRNSSFHRPMRGLGLVAVGSAALSDAG